MPADDVAGDNQFHATILLTPGRSVVRHHRLGLSESFRRHRTGGNALLSQIVAHRDPALLGKLLVVVVATYIIGVSLYFQLQTGVPRNDARDFCQLLPCSRTPRIRSRIE